MGCLVWCCPPFTFKWSKHCLQSLAKAVFFFIQTTVAFLVEHGKEKKPWQRTEVSLTLCIQCWFDVVGVLYRQTITKTEVRNRCICCCKCSFFLSGRWGFRFLTETHRLYAGWGLLLSLWSTSVEQLAWGPEGSKECGCFSRPAYFFPFI